MIEAGMLSASASPRGPGDKEFLGRLCRGLVCWLCGCERASGGCVMLKANPACGFGSWGVAGSLPGCWRGVGGLPRRERYAQPSSFSSAWVQLVFTSVPSSQANVRRDGMVD